MRRHGCLLAMVLVLALARIVPTADAQHASLPPATLVLIFAVPDENEWLAMQQEVLATPQEAQKSLVVTIPDRAGDSRTLVILTPKFTSTISSTAGSSVRVVVKGTVEGDYAQQTLVPFMHAFSESGATDNRVTVEYGLTALAAKLMELKLENR